MTIIIKKGTTKEEVEKLLLKLNKTKKKTGLRKYFGKLIVNTKGLDAVAYQKMLRNEWD
jgi:hypothetical protein